MSGEERWSFYLILHRRSRFVADSGICREIFEASGRFKRSQAFHFHLKEKNTYPTFSMFFQMKIETFK